MAVVHSPDSGYAKEMRKWEAQHSQFGPPGRPYTYQPYPTRMYRAGRNEHGQSAILEAATAGDDDERAKLEARGFVAGGQQAALDALAGQEQEFARLAAERNFEVRRMSERAQQEVATVEAEAGAQHLPTIPETPVKRRGRPRKADTAAAE